MALEIGRYNTLKALRRVDAGMVLDGGEDREILMPNKYLLYDMEPGAEVTVFVSYDSKDRLVATTDKPFAMAGEFAFLDVVAVGKVGAFLDWGMDKDLLLPFGAQPRERVKVGEKVLVYVDVDDVSNRMVASMNLARYLLDQAPSDAKEKAPVDMLIAKKTDLGFKAIVNHAYWGLLYDNQIFEPLKKGEQRRGYIQKVREDGKVDLMLDAPGYAKIDGQAAKILEALKVSEGGVLPFNDKSDPEAIKQRFNISKKVFKQSIGSLYKKRIIAIEDDGIRLL